MEIKVRMIIGWCFCWADFLFERWSANKCFLYQKFFIFVPFGTNCHFFGLKITVQRPYTPSFISLMIPWISNCPFGTYNWDENVFTEKVSQFQFCWRKNVEISQNLVLRLSIPTLKWFFDHLQIIKSYVLKVTFFRQNNFMGEQQNFLIYGFLLGENNIRVRNFQHKKKKVLSSLLRSCDSNLSNTISSKLDCFHTYSIQKVLTNRQLVRKVKCCRPKIVFFLKNFYSSLLSKLSRDQNVPYYWVVLRSRSHYMLGQVVLKKKSYILPLRKFRFLCFF